MIFSRKVIKPKKQEVQVVEEIQLDVESYDWYAFKHPELEEYLNNQPNNIINETVTIQPLQNKVEVNNKQEETKDQLMSIPHSLPQISKSDIVVRKGNYTLKFNRLEHRQKQFLQYKVTPKLPNMVDLRSKFMPIVDQGQLGSCTACCLQGLVSSVTPKFVGSRLFLYYNERVKEGTVNQDSGAYLIDGIKSLITYGLCPETMWPYDISQFATRPTKACYKEALKHQLLTYKVIPQDIYSIKNALNQGYAFTLGIAVYESFEWESTFASGIVPLPNPNKEDLLGFHAIVVVGYNDKLQCFLCRNSWGDQIYGQLRGYFFLPYLFCLDSHLSTDLFTIISYEK